MVDRIPLVVVERDADGCLLVISHRPGPNGYIPYVLDGRQTYLHRIVSSAQVGEEIDHTCHNADPSCPGGACKHRLCINREHLEVLAPDGTNQRRGFAGGRYRKAFCKRGHSLEDAYVSKSGGRQCRTCTRDRARERYRQSRHLG